MNLLSEMRSMCHNILQLSDKTSPDFYLFMPNIQTLYVSVITFSIFLSHQPTFSQLFMLSWVFKDVHTADAAAQLQQSGCLKAAYLVAPGTTPLTYVLTTSSQ